MLGIVPKAYMCGATSIVIIRNINIVAFDIISWIGLNEEVREYPVQNSLIELREAPDPLTSKQEEGPARACAMALSFR